MPKMADNSKVTRAYAGGDSNVAKESREGNNGFKKGGKVKKDDRPRRASGGGVFSAAQSGTPRKPASHY
jgi:hypothetical protein